MFCENCGNKIQDGHKFCIKCGHLATENLSRSSEKSQNTNNNERWWHRLLRVLYIVAYLPLLGIIPAVWSSYVPYCTHYTYTYSNNYCSGSYAESFWYSLLTLVIYFVVLRLIKIATLYIVKGRKPEWKKEFKKLF